MPVEMMLRRGRRGCGWTFARAVPGCIKTCVIDNTRLYVVGHRLEDFWSLKFVSLRDSYKGLDVYMGLDVHIHKGLDVYEGLDSS